MSKRIITISREFGSGGRFIGEQTAKKLGIDYYDKEIIEKTAKRTGFTKEFIEKKGEYAPTGNLFAYTFVGRGMDGASLDDYLFSVQREIIFEASMKGPCVIVGRCADYILRERDDCLNVFVCGNLEQKKKRIMELYHASENEAVKMMRDTDKKRSVNYQYFTDQKWGNAANYAVALNSSVIGYEKCVDLLVQLYQ